MLEPADLAQAVLNRLQALETIDPKLPSRDEGGVSPAKTQSPKVYPPTSIVVAPHVSPGAMGKRTRGKALTA